MTIFSTFTGFGCAVFRLFPTWSKTAKLWVHAVMLTVGFAVGAAGMADKYISRVYWNKAGFEIALIFDFFGSNEILMSRSIRFFIGPKAK